MPENPYHEVPYVTNPRFETHPDRLAAVATLFGMKPAPVRQCRVLEIGCGNGNNLIPMAYHLPESRFTGVDLAEQAVAAGKCVIAGLGLSNIELIAADLRQIDESFGQFDYVIAHGLYSWVPPDIRDALLAAIAARLAAHGVAFLSYNAFPGGHVRKMLREMMLYHTRQCRDLSERVAQGRWFLDWLHRSKAINAAWIPMLDEEIAGLLAYRPDSLAHDALGEWNECFYFHEVAGNAAAHGLQYLGDALNQQVFDTRGVLQSLEGGPLERAQYLDFSQLRPFGQTLFCRQEVALNRSPEPSVFDRMWFSSPAHEVDGQIEGDNGIRLTAGQPTVEPLVLALGRSYPQPMSFEELLPYAAGREALRNVLGALVFTSFVQYHVHDFACQRTVTERPAGSRLARYQARESNQVSIVRHGLVELDEPGRQLLLLLDGTRDHHSIAREMARMEGTLPLEEIERGLPDSLARFAALGLLEG